MIAYLKGTVLETEHEAVIVETGGVGYQVSVTPATLRRLIPGQPIKLFISESTALYGGGTSLYGFVSREEKDIFLSLREVPNTGAKKALEHLDKASRSLPDFRRAILDGDARMLCGVFGFTSKTADRLVAALKDKLGAAHPSGSSRAVDLPMAGPKTRAMQQALDALISLGYKPAESRQTLQAVSTELSGKETTVEEMIRMALKRL